jgi:hypothetical protein
MNTTRSYLSGCGLQTAALGFGGFTTVITAATEEYNGTSWSNTTSMTTARQKLAGAGTQTAGLGFGGLTTVNVANTEEFNFSSLITVPAAWASGGNMGTARRNLAGAGTQTAGLRFWW